MKRKLLGLSVAVMVLFALVRPVVLLELRPLQLILWQMAY